METVILTVGSITFAQRARNLLASRKILANLVRARQSGCSYGVRVDREKDSEAQEILRSAGMKAEVT